MLGLIAGLATPPVARRFGGTPRAWPWPIVGAAAGAAIGWHLAPAPATTKTVWLVVLAVGVPLAAIDLAVHRLPDALVLPALAATATLAAAAGEVRALVAGVALTAAYAVVALLPRSGLGFGDVKFAGVLGIALGLLGWSAVGWGTAYAFLLGGTVAAALLLSGRAGRDTPLAFGPYLLAGAVLAAILDP
jgi:leader peptidase (prepilin peptidase)/N-methyltransferase